MGLIHRDRRYVKGSAIVRGLANGTPTAVCWRCGLTLAEHPPHRNGRPPRWQAGHTIDGSTRWEIWAHVSIQPPPDRDVLAPEASTCNTSAGATHGNARRASGYDWP